LLSSNITSPGPTEIRHPGAALHCDVLAPWWSCIWYRSLMKFSILPNICHRVYRYAASIQENQTLAWIRRLNLIGIPTNMMALGFLGGFQRPST
jgi:hypothetical protein